MRAQEMFIVCSGKLRENNLSFARQHLNKADTRPHKQKYTEHWQMSPGVKGCLVGPQQSKNVA